MTDWKSLCKQLVHDLEDWHIAFGHEAQPKAANETFDLIERVKTALEVETRAFSELTKDFDDDRRKRINEQKEKLHKWSLDGFLNRFKDPVQAKQFLVNAGIIDEEGKLSKQYQP